MQIEEQESIYAQTHAELTDRQDGWITVHSPTLGTQQVAIVSAYKHLGGMYDHRLTGREAVSHRTTSATTGYMPFIEETKGEDILPTRTHTAPTARLHPWGGDILTRINCNANTWPNMA